MIPPSGQASCSDFTFEVLSCEDLSCEDLSCEDLFCVDLFCVDMGEKHWQMEGDLYYLDIKVIQLDAAPHGVLMPRRVFQ